MTTGQGYEHPTKEDDVSLEDLDASMFAPHPNGYLCRCGMVHLGKPESCTCPSDFPEAVISDLAARIARLERVLRQELEDGTNPDSERVFRVVLGMDDED